jgi:leucyl aminopeptidase
VTPTFLDVPALDALDASTDLLVVGVRAPFAQDAALAAVEARLAGLGAHLAARGFEAAPGEALVLPTYGALATSQVAILGLGDASTAALRKAAGKIGAIARDQKASNVAVDLGALDDGSLATLLEFAAIGNYRWDTHQPEKARTPALANLAISGASKATRDATAARAGLRARWQAFARDLVNRPAADLTPTSLATAAQGLAQLPHVTVHVTDFEACKAQGMVGLVAVGQGSTEPGCLIHVSYQPTNPRDTIALVGKGVTFDSGGLSLKPSDAMQTMRCDMGGAATALAAIGAIAELGLPIRVDAFLPCVENMVAGNSYKLGDILHYRNGVTCEIHNTDAEGRLILADALIEACAVPGVSRVVDLATLTGAIIIALGSEFTGLFTPDDALAAELDAAFASAGELAWRQPLHAPYKRLLKGTWSQIKNVGGREGGSITAALFLQHFVTDNVRWAHLDIAGTAFADAPNEPYTAGGTGQVVRTLVDWATQIAT